MQPEYFHKYLTFYEADDYLAGVSRRYHTQWEAARWETTFIAKCAGNRNYKAPDFPWEKEQHTQPEITEEDIRRMKEEGAAFAARLNNKGKQ